ncbi:MAG TPA: GNAT family N-acetyltransferase [Pyrinomonadaceae bacterium]
MVDSQGLSFEVLDDLTKVEEVAGEWNELLDRSRCNRAFSSAAWYLAACRHDPAAIPNVVLARSGDGKLLAVLPLALLDDGKTAAFPIRFSDYNDIVAAPEDLDVAASLLRKVIAEPKEYRRVSLQNLRDDSNCVRAASLIFSPAEFGQKFRVTTVCPYILLPASYDQYLTTRSPKLRKNLRRALRDADRNDVIVEELQPESFAADQLAEVFLSLQLNRKGANSCFTPANLQSFIREVVQRLFTERRLLAFAVIERNEIVGIDLYMVGANSICSWNGGFLTEAAHWSPVKLLNDAAIKRAFSLRLEEYDYLRGEHPYKLSWTNSKREIGELVVNVGDYNFRSRGDS